MAATDSMARVIEAPERGAVRAVMIGIDLYRNVPPLHGAVADAEDLSLSLRSVGVEDMTL
ncbi:caspase, partial [Rhizobium ruizarguesonis]